MGTHNDRPVKTIVMSIPTHNIGYRIEIINLTLYSIDTHFNISTKDSF